MKNFILLSTFLFFISNIFAQSTGATAAGTVTSDNSNGENDSWTDLGNIAASDDSYSELSAANDKLPNGQTTEYLKCTNFGYTIPAGATITGVEVVIERQDQANKNAKDAEVRLVVGGVVVGSNYKKAGQWDAESTQIYGGAADVWGTGGLTVAQVNAANFGMVLSAISGHNNTKPKVDLVTINVYYTAPVVLDIGPGSGNTLNFDGSNDYVSLGTSASLRPVSAITIEAWTKYNSQGGYECFSSNTQDNNCDESGWYFGPDGGGNMNFWIATVGQTCHDWGDVAGASTLNEWEHWAGTYDGNTIRLYRNGVLVDSDGSKSGNINWSNLPADCRIGMYYDDNEAYYMDGSVDELRIWNDVRTQIEIRTNMCKKLNGNEAGLVSYYRFDESTGSVLADHSGSNNGTLNNMSNADWIYSGAALGNTSTSLYTIFWGGQEIYLQSPEGDSMRVSSVTGNPDGIHIYHVNELPNGQAGIVGGGANDHYYGVFVAKGTAPTYTGTYYYRENDAYQLGAYENSMMTFIRDDNADLTWLNSGALLNTTTKTLTMTNLNTEMFLGNTGAPLPIDLVSFTAILNNNQVDLKWLTSTEINNDYFTIERSTDGKNWKKVLTVNGAGNSSVLQNYFDVDYAPLEGVSYYRLKQTDYNGKYTYSDVVFVNMEDDHTKSFDLYPNPVQVGREFFLSFQNEEKEIQIVLRDVLGKEFYSKEFFEIEKGESIKIPVDVKMTAGVYVVVVTSNNQLYREKIILK